MRKSKSNGNGVAVEERTEDALAGTPEAQEIASRIVAADRDVVQTMKRSRGRAASAAPVSVVIPAPSKEVLRIRIEGTAQVVTSVFSEKAKEQMRQAQMGGARLKKAPKDPWACYVDSMYWLSRKPASPTESDVKKASFGLPAVCLKAAAVDACRFVDGLPMTFAKRLIYVRSHEVVDGLGLLKIECPKGPKMIESMVRNANGNADIRYRGAFWPWAIEFEVEFLANYISRESVVNLYSLAGMTGGLGEWRPSAKFSNTGQWGTFSVVPS